MEEGRDDKQRELGSASIVNNEPYTLGKLRACICMSLRPSALVCHFRESINTFTTIEPSEYNIPGMEICHRPCPHLLHTYTCIYPAIYTCILILHHVYCIIYILLCILYHVQCLYNNTKYFHSFPHSQSQTYKRWCCPAATRVDRHTHATQTRRTRSMYLQRRLWVQWIRRYVSCIPS